MIASRRVRLQQKIAPSATESLEAVKAWATIISALAMPIVVAVVGYFVQQQLANEGLKKDYVQIAIGVLNQDPAKQELELRQWAVRVLDTNSPVPFTDKLRDSLFRVSIGTLPTGQNVEDFLRCRALQDKLVAKQDGVLTKEEAEQAVKCFMTEGIYTSSKTAPLAGPSNLKIQ